MNAFITLNDIWSPNVINVSSVSSFEVPSIIVPKIFSENAAKRFNLKGKGFIKKGFDADLTVVDLSKEGVFDIDEFYTKAEYSPFDGFEYKGIATKTIVGGKLVMDDGEVFTS